MFLLWGKDLTCFYNDALLPGLNTTGKHAALGKPGNEVWATVWDLVGPQVDKAMATGQAVWFDNQPIPFLHDSRADHPHGTFTYSPVFDDDGRIGGVLATAYPTTASPTREQHKLAQSEKQYRTLIEESPVAIAVYATRDFIIDTANNAMITVWGKTPAVIGMKLTEALPELEGQPFIKLLEDVYDTGIAYQSDEQQANLVVNGILQEYWFTFTYKPLLNDDQEVYAILNVAVDVTERVMSRRWIEKSQQQLLASFEQSPVAIAMINATDLAFTMANPFYGELVGRTPDQLVGKHLLEALPELQGQGFDKLLGEVIDTGIPYMANEVAVDLIRRGRLETIYIDLTYQPQYEIDQDVAAPVSGIVSQPEPGRVMGVLVVATDITQQVLARKRIEETEASLRGAIELAELATWSLDIQNEAFHYSPRFMDWLGFSESTKPIDEAYNPLPDDYRQRVAAAINAAIDPNSTGLYENEHPIVNRLTGQVRIIHAQAQLFRNTNGKPVRLSGTARDITEQRRLQLALEQQVKQRTEELATSNSILQATNEELAALNEEYASINEEYLAMNEDLHESNELLIQSNTNLERFAYVASHDLQEPLRKVQQFGDLLTSQYAAQLGEGVLYLERMQAAAFRMSNLIHDLLSFSRIVPRQDAVALVSLNDVINTILSDLDLLIQETGAVIEVDHLPTILGDASQLGQLFQNLISNAIKFRQTDAEGRSVAPHIQIKVQLIAATDLPVGVNPTRSSGAYYQVSIIDNGIGFDEKYTTRIFQIFQRLHGKSEYAGTGIGLAICEKVAANHGGAITATSQLGQGSTFSVYLPV
ncbi:PAS domain-containing protein [Fibrella forsythiae]|uniref:histidine kinase n=1 Tax=Fibrella forsythiae TaxID=2817061 RepID=A0ABS3JK28_9BACT|nr:PAS domain-containing protein [Fibrella forsythiae]MBO0950359.1 PAS domain-containing protein [Fibrella forsythiae]